MKSQMSGKEFYPIQNYAAEAFYFLKQGELNKANSLLLESQAIYGKTPETLLLLAKVHEEQNHFTTSLKYYESCFIVYNDIGVRIKILKLLLLIYEESNAKIRKKCIAKILYYASSVDSVSNLGWELIFKLIILLKVPENCKQCLKKEFLNKIYSGNSLPESIETTLLLELSNTDQHQKVAERIIANSWRLKRSISWAKLNYDILTEVEKYHSYFPSTSPIGFLWVISLYNLFFLTMQDGEYDFIGYEQDLVFIEDALYYCNISSWTNDDVERSSFRQCLVGNIAFFKEYFSLKCHFKDYFIENLTTDLCYPHLLRIEKIIQAYPTRIKNYHFQEYLVDDRYTLCDLYLSLLLFCSSKEEKEYYDQPITERLELPQLDKMWALPSKKEIIKEIGEMNEDLLQCEWISLECLLYLFTWHIPPKTYVSFLQYLFPHLDLASDDENISIQDALLFIYLLLLERHSYCIQKYDVSTLYQLHTCLALAFWRPSHIAKRFWATLFTGKLGVHQDPNVVLGDEEVLICLLEIRGEHKAHKKQVMHTILRKKLKITSTLLNQKKELKQKDAILFPYTLWLPVNWNFKDQHYSLRTLMDNEWTGITEKVLPQSIPTSRRRSLRDYSSQPSNELQTKRILRLWKALQTGKRE